MSETRRQFLGEAAAALSAAGGQGQAQAGAGQAPWHRRALRWGQTNITERDPERYDVAFWREYWKRTRVQGVIINAGGIVAYYPSKYPLHRRAEFLGDRDLYGELVEAAHRDGLAVLARMDSNRAAAEFFRAHPGWFARDAAGEPYRAADKYITCVNSPYYEEYIPGILTEIIERSKPEGLTDNSWSGLGRESICYCENCSRKFRDSTGHAIPRRKDWNDAAYRAWIRWNYDRRLEIWDLNNRASKAAGGPHCLWVGMNSGSIANQCRSFRDYKEICRRAEIIMLDHQARSDAWGFQQNAETGKLIHGLLGWEKPIPESMSMYASGRVSFRLAAKPADEARMWMLAGFAGGIQPWWHHVGAYHEDRRAYKTAEPVMRWHERNEQYLVNRRPVAAVGVVWSQQNTDFYGRDDAADLVETPYRGMVQALVRARIPYIPLHADHIERDAGSLAVLALPNFAAMSDGQCAAVRRFAERGGALVATGASTLCDEWGDARRDFALADLFGAHAAGLPEARWASGAAHSYLRLEGAAGRRHPVLRGFEETDILPFGGMLAPMRVDEGAVVAATFIPPFPIYPPETAWMREPKTDIPAMVLHNPGKARVAYLPADIDRRFARENLPDHGDLLANVIRWAAGGGIPLAVEGRGLLDCHLYAQPGRLILHIVNLTSAAAWRAPVHELIPVGPLKVRVRLPEGARAAGVKLLVAGASAPATVERGWVSFECRSVLDHEVAVIG